MIADRKSIAIYCVSIEHVEQVVLALDAYGIDCEFVHSKAGDDHNAQALARFGAGQSRFIASMGQLTTGWDCPRLDCIIMLRPTRSPGLWVQMLGRGTRPFFCLDAYQGTDGIWRVPDLGTKEGRLLAIARSQKHSCLVLDFARNTEDIGPFDDPRIPKRRGPGGGEAIMKACQKGRMTDPKYIGCGTYAWPAERYCKECGQEFYFEVKFDSSTSGAALMTGKRDPKPYIEPEIATFPVTRVSYARHQKPGKPDSIRVAYTCGMRQFKTFLCPDHGGGATARAKGWWRKHIDSHPPNGVDTWLERMDEARIPVSIQVKLKKDWPDVMDWYFE
jgi:DNA repair protein RadD